MTIQQQTQTEWIHTHLAHHSILSRSEEHLLIERSQQGCIKSRDRLILQNQRLVVNIAHRNPQFGEFEDLVQEGTLGLVRAIEKFDLSRRYKLSTYAVPWIWQYMQQYSYTKKRVVRVPVHWYEKRDKVAKFCQKFRIECDRSPSEQDISEGTGIGIASLREMYRLTNCIYSLNYAHTDDGVELLDGIVDGRAEPMEWLEQQDQIKSIIYPRLRKLAPEHQRVIKLRFRIGEAPGRIRSLPEIERLTGWSHSVVRSYYRYAMLALKGDLASYCYPVVTRKANG